MQILYITAIVAVSVLCIALLSTARRILHASPIAATSMGIGSVSALAAPMEAANLDWELDVPAESTTPAYADTAAVIAPAPQPEIIAAPAPPPDVPRTGFLSFEPVGETAAGIAVAEPESAAVPAATVKQGATSRRFFTCAFECAVLGVSAWVLIRTQKELHRTSSERGRHVA
jgi:hypothetical protein